jgi:hypothetical protein
MNRFALILVSLVAVSLAAGCELLGLVPAPVDGSGDVMSDPVVDVEEGTSVVPEPVVEPVPVESVVMEGSAVVVPVPVAPVVEEGTGSPAEVVVPPMPVPVDSEGTVDVPVSEPVVVE